MSHGHTRISTKGYCIYCGCIDEKLTDEHVVPFSLGGVHILEKASCEKCANITKKFEQDVARELWGDARNSYNFPSRRKKQRKKTISFFNNEKQENTIIEYTDYPAPFVFYKMLKAGALQNLPEDLDLSALWVMVANVNDSAAKAFKEKYQIDLPARFRNVPEIFARLIIKIAYCHILTEIERTDFDATCIPYIMGDKRNLSYIIGTKDAFDHIEGNYLYKLQTIVLRNKNKLTLVVEVKLLANQETPIYEVVVGKVEGLQRVSHLMNKIGDMSIQLLI